jgi:MYXO-CTERM domain-containing protein
MVSMSTSIASGALPADVVDMLVQRQAPAITSCYQEALNRGSTWSGQLPVRLAVTSTGVTNGDPVIAARGVSDAALSACVVRALAGVRFPPPENGQGAALQVSVNLSSAPRDPWQQQMQLQGFVLTRLHARYSKSALNEDLVFRPAGPIVGGREFVQTDGKLEEGSRPDSVNNFQARYAIRHPWEGPIACANPRRGIWGGPPAGVNADTSVRPATDLAFAPRGNVTLAQMVRQNVPELGLTATQTIASTLGAGTTGATTSTDVPPSPGGGGCGMCSIGGGGDVPVGLFAFVGLVGLFALRRSR